MGRPKGSKNKPRTAEKPQGRIVFTPTDVNKKIVTQDGQIFEKHEYFTFKSRMAGTLFFPGDDGVTKQIEGHSVRDDITTREREYILNCGAYQEGLVVELTHDSLDHVQVLNAINDSQITAICDQYIKTKDKEKFLSFVNGMTAEITLSALREKALELELPGYMIKYIEGRMEELAEAEAKAMESPTS